MSELNKREIPLARIEMLDGSPICVAKDGTTVIALQWDYAGWTPGAARFSKEVGKFAEQPPRNKKVLVAISADVSPRLRQEMGALNYSLKDRLDPGPLK
jgi:hypothetical protein